jgi:hypothetical protein
MSILASLGLSVPLSRFAVLALVPEGHVVIGSSLIQFQ